MFEVCHQTSVNVKDKVSKDEPAGVVYQIHRSDCDAAAYVGETERSLCKCVSEHHRSSSPLGHHLNQCRHSFSEKEVSAFSTRRMIGSQMGLRKPSTSPGRAPPWTETGEGTPSWPSTGRSSSHMTRFQHPGHVMTCQRSSHQLT